MQANVSASVGESNGCWKKLSVFLTAVMPKLVPSRQASRWTRNHGHRLAGVGRQEPSGRR